MPILGSQEEFPDCPAYYLRGQQDGMPAEHLIDGAVHPYERASVRATEFKNGAIASDAMTPKELEAVLLYCREDASRTKWEMKQRTEAARGDRR